MNKPDRIQIHRFHDYASVSFCNDESAMTFYLTKETAKNLSIELLLLSNEIEEVAFVGSGYGTEIIEQES